MSDGPYEQSGMSDRPMCDRPVSDHPIIDEEFMRRRDGLETLAPTEGPCAGA